MSIKEAFAQVPAFKDSRLASLYSDFSHLKDYNPEGYEANCKAWRDLITQCIKGHAFGSSVSVPGTLASSLASPSYGEPKALHAIVDQMVKEKVLIPWSVFQTCSFSPATSLTDYILPSAILSRSWTSLKLSLYASRSAANEEYFIHLAILTEKAEEILLKLREHVQSQGVYSAKLFNEETLIQQLRDLDAKISTLDAKCLILYLSRDTQKLKVLKKEQPEVETYLKLDNSDITENDLDIIKLKATIQRVELRTASLEQKVDVEIPRRIHNLLSATDKKSETTRSRVKNLLYQKARASKSLEHSSTQLGNLTNILDEIDKAETNASMLTTLQSATKALAAFNEQTNLNDVDNLMSDIDEQISKTNVLSDALTIAQNDDYDSGEIERELEELEAEETRTTETTSRESEENEEVLERLRNISLNDKPIADFKTEVEADAKTPLPVSYTK